MAPVKFPLLLKATLGLPFCSIAPQREESSGHSDGRGRSFLLSMSPSTAQGLVPEAQFTSVSSWLEGAEGAPSGVSTMTQEKECGL